MTPITTRPWQVWVDTGGTFTDCVAQDPEGAFHRAKVLSTSALRGVVSKQIDRQGIRIAEKWDAPSDFVRGFQFRLLDYDSAVTRVEEYDSEAGTLTLDRPFDSDQQPQSAFEVCSPEEAPVLAARLVTRTLPTDPLPELNMRLATTRGTNALLERKGVPTALFITRGFADLLLIGTQQRPDIFALEIRKPEPLYQTVVEVDERIASDGSVLCPLKLVELQKEVEELLNKGVRAAAVALMHSYQNPNHEKELAQFLTRAGFGHVSYSSEVAPFIKIVPRAETTVADAYLAPIIKDYLKRVAAVLSTGSLHIMTSAGGLIRAAEYSAKDSLLSGPAGGVVGAAAAGGRSGFDKIIAFDMGGTSTDVARFDGDYEYVFEHEVGDAHLVAPALAIETVAAGGGSICHYDGYRLRVGPESASAEPGPACYGAGGPLTLTDVNLLLGRLDPSRFEIPISKNAASRRLLELEQAIQQGGGQESESAVLLQGFLDIANERMADAISRVSVRKGYDPASYALVAFGGAGGQHACAVAHRLGISRIIVPEDASFLSALGLRHAVVERFAEQQILRPLNEVKTRLAAWMDELAQEARAQVAAEGVPADQIEVRRRIANIRFVGQDSVLSVECDDTNRLSNRFRGEYVRTFGHLPAAREIEVESLRVVCSSRSNPRITQKCEVVANEPKPTGFTQAHFDGEWREVPVYGRDVLSRGAHFSGPAVIFEQHSAIVVEVGWRAKLDAAGAIVITATT